MRTVFWLLLALYLPVARAEPWLCTQTDGHKEFNYEPESARNPNCVDTPLSRGYVRRSRSPAEESSAASPAEFPRINARTQKQRDLARRDILQRELDEERKSLEAAIAELAELKVARVGAAAPAPAALKRYEDRIRVHRTNIANLQKELGHEG